MVIFSAPARATRSNVIGEDCTRQGGGAPRPRAPLVGLCRPPAAPRLEVRQHVPHDLQSPANWPLTGKPPKAVHRDALELVPVVVLQLPQSAQAPRGNRRAGVQARG